MFDLTVKDVRKLAFDLADKMQIPHPFNKNNRMAGKDWVQKFMTRLNLSLRYPQGTSIARASGFNKQQTGKFFELYRTLVQGRDFPPPPRETFGTWTRPASERSNHPIKL